LLSDATCDTRTALNNLDSLAEYISQDDPEAAARMVERIYAAVQNLAQHPSMGRPGRVPKTRELVISNTPYIVPYRVKGSAVHACLPLLRVFHAAKRWPQDF
jgi:toxin ParE1/3/4